MVPQTKEGMMDEDLIIAQTQQIAKMPEDLARANTGGKNAFIQGLHGDYIVIFKHFTQQKTSGYMLSFFEKKTPLWSPCTQGSNCDYIWKKNTTLITMYPVIT